MERILQEIEPDTVGTLLVFLSDLPEDTPVTDCLGECAIFRVTEDTETGERCLEVS